MQLSRLTHEVTLDNMMLNDLAESKVPHTGELMLSFEVVAPNRTGRHKYDARPRLVGGGGGLCV